MSISRLISLIAGENTFLSFHHSSFRSFYISLHGSSPVRPECKLRLHPLYRSLPLSASSIRLKVSFAECWRSPRLLCKMKTHHFMLFANNAILIRHTYDSQRTVNVSIFVLTQFYVNNSRKISKKVASCLIWLEPFIRKAVWASFPLHTIRKVGRLMQSWEVSQAQILLKCCHHKTCSTWQSRESTYFWAQLSYLWNPICQTRTD